jgi:tetratricopeptide (TPR) repeat protein
MDGAAGSRQQVQMLLDLGRPADAFTLATELLAHSPDDRVVLGWAALAQLRLGVKDEARRLSHRALSVDPTYAYAQLLAAYTYLPQRPRKALPEFERAIAMDPDDFENHVGLVKAVWRIAASPLPSDPPIHSPRWCRKAERTRAVEAAERAVTLAPSEVDAHVAVARAAYLAGHYPDAISACDSARQLDPTNTEAAHIQATVLERLGLHAEAGDSLVSAVHARPADTAAVNRLQQIQAEGDWGIFFLIAVIFGVFTYVAFADPDLTAGDFAAIGIAYLFCASMGWYFWHRRKRAKLLSEEAAKIIAASRKLN